MNIIIDQLLKHNLIIILVIAVGWIISFFKSSNIERRLYAKELTIVPEFLRVIFIFSLFFVFPSLLIGNITIDPNKNIDFVTHNQIRLIILAIITFPLTYFTILLIEGTSNKKLVSKLNLHKFNSNKLIIPLIIISTVLIVFSFGKLLNYILLLGSSIENVRIENTLSTIAVLFKVNKNLSYGIFLVLLLVILIIGTLLFNLIRQFLSYIEFVFFKEDIKCTVLLKSGVKIHDVYVFNSPMGKFIFVGNNKKSSDSTQKVAIKKDEIEFIQFQRTFNNAHEKNPIIITGFKNRRK